MARVRQLNPKPAVPTLGPVELSQAILTEARAAASPGECAALDRLAGELRGIDPAAIKGDAERIAFWINLYNALVLHCLCLNPLHGSLLRHLRLFDRIAYRVGEHEFPLNLIENGILRRNRRAPLRLRRPLRAGDPRLAATPSTPDPRVHFALNCAAASCPPIAVYDSRKLDSQLELATAAYLRNETVVEGKRVRLPRLMRIYHRDFGSRDEQLAFAARYVPALAAIAAERRRVRIRYGRFDWTVAPRPSR